MCYFLSHFTQMGQVLTPPDPNYSENPDTVIDGAFMKKFTMLQKSGLQVSKDKRKRYSLVKNNLREIDLRQKINHHFYYPLVIQKKKTLEP